MQDPQKILNGSSGFSARVFQHSQFVGCPDFVIFLNTIVLNGFWIFLKLFGMSWSPKMNNIGSGSFGHIRKSENHAHEGFRVFSKWILKDMNPNWSRIIGVFGLFFSNYFLGITQNAYKCVNIFPMISRWFSIHVLERDAHGARLGVGISRGTMKFQGDSKFDRPQVTRFHNPPWITQKTSTHVQHYFKFNKIYLCFRIINNYSRFTKIPPSYCCVVI